MEDDGLRLRRRILFLLIVGALITIFTLIPANVVSYNKAATIPAPELSTASAASSTISTALSTTTEPEETEQEETAIQSHEEAERTVIAPAPEKPYSEIPIYDPETERILHAIALCESQDRHFDVDGSVLMNRHGSSATGRYQLMASVWRPVAESMGINIDTEAGNKQMAYHILTDAQGLVAWAASASCLAKHNVFIK